MALNFQKALKIAQALGDAEESTSYGSPAIKLRGKLVARLKEDGDSLVVGTTFEERAEMMATDPGTYYITDHYLTAPWVLVRLSKVHPDALRDLLGQALKLAQKDAQTRPVKRRSR
ncbi:MAG TPA: MmcQ/YjbR family DNA-binding protein [Bryobacteraceae bacterium]|nr:MmcQ/YjbR family DNA-binding protein [Bryobacteraceae bacterium]